MSTYRQSLEQMKPQQCGKQVNISNFTALMYRFLSWLVKTTNRQSGYVEFMAQNKDPTSAFDIIEVVYNCIDDNECCMTLPKEDMEKLDKLKRTIKLIQDNLDHTIRIDRHTIYDEETDNEDPLMDCDMLTAVFNYANHFTELQFRDDSDTNDKK